MSKQPRTTCYNCNGRDIRPLTEDEEWYCHTCGELFAPKPMTHSEPTDQALIVSTMSIRLDNLKIGVDESTYEELCSIQHVLERTEAKRVEAENRVKLWVERVDEAHTIAHAAPELNMDNYTHEEVDQINDAMTKLFGLLLAAEGEIDEQATLDASEGGA
jgi:hypothetical protein